MQPGLKSLLDFTNFVEDTVEKTDKQKQLELCMQQQAVIVKQLEEIDQTAYLEYSAIHAQTTTAIRAYGILKQTLQNMHDTAQRVEKYKTWTASAQEPLQQLRQNITAGNAHSLLQALHIIDFSLPIIIDIDKRSVEFTTIVIYLENKQGVAQNGEGLGPFTVKISMTNNTWGAVLQAHCAPKHAYSSFCVPSYDDDPDHECDDDCEEDCELDNPERYFHPHVSSDGSCCLGTAIEPVGAALATGNVLEALHIICTFLTSYNHSNPYELCAAFGYDENDFDTIVCQFCGTTNACICPDLPDVPQTCLRCAAVPANQACWFCMPCCLAVHTCRVVDGAIQHQHRSEAPYGKHIWQKDFDLFTAGLAADLDSYRSL